MRSIKTKGLLCYEHESPMAAEDAADVYMGESGGRGASSDAGWHTLEWG